MYTQLKETNQQQAHKTAGISKPTEARETISAGRLADSRLTKVNSEGKAMKIRWTVAARIPLLMIGFLTSCQPHRLTSRGSKSVIYKQMRISKLSS